MQSKGARLAAAGVRVGLAGLAVATLVGFLGGWSWIADLLSHFRAQYAGAAALLLVAAACLRRAGAATAGAALLALNAACLAPAFVHVRATVHAAAPTLSLVLSNVSLEQHNPELAPTLVRAWDPDVLGFVEVDERWVSELDTALVGHPHRYRVAKDNHYGIALYSRRPLLSVEERPVNDRRYPALLARLPLGDRTVRLLLAHAHPPFQVRVSRMRDRQIASLAQIRRESRGPFVLLGDLNASPWSHPFRSLLAATDLRDSRAGRGLQGSWPAAWPALRIPLDHCLVSPDLRVVDRQVGPEVGSDHLPLYVKLAPAS